MKERHSLVITGISTIFLIFAVLTVGILALLSLGNSRTARSLSQKALSHTQSYYEAVSLSADWCSQVEPQLEAFFQQTGEKESYFQIISEKHAVSFPDSEYDSEKHILSHSFPISDSQSLLVSMEILFPEHNGDSWIRMTSHAITP